MILLQVYFHFHTAYTHGMLKNLFVTHKNGLAFDVTSEYPYVMMAKYYPMGTFKTLNEAFEKAEQEEITEAKKEDNTVITWPSGKKLKLVTNYHITEEDLDLFEEALRKQ